MENFFRAIGYILLLVVNIIIYWFLHSHFHFVLLIIMILAPVFSIITAYRIRKYLSVKVVNSGLKGEYGRQGQESFFLIKLSNPTLWPSLDVKLKVNVRNEFFGNSGDLLVSVPLYSKKGYELRFPIVADLPGRITLEVKEVRIKDLMGFAFLKKDINKSGETIILPSIVGETNHEKSYFESGMLESEESSKKGNDFSDVQEIREYIPGDKLMSIHWKLSAKRDILMVKDRVSMSDKQLVVLPELCNENPYELNMILSTTYSLIYSLVKDKLTVRLMYWSKNRYEYEDIRIDYKEGLDDAFSKMFYEECYKDMNQAASHMSLVHPEMKSFLHISAQAGKVLVLIRENA